MGFRGVARASIAAAVAVSICTAASGALAPAPAAAAPCSSGTTLHSLNVEVEWSKRVYRVGQKARAVITVTRPGPEDPLQNGIPLDPPTRAPAEGINVGTTLMVGFPFIYDVGETDEDGRFEAVLPLTKRTRGEVAANTIAWKLHNQGGPACSEVEELGHAYQQPAFRVR